MAQYLSPGVSWSEIDLTGITPTVQTSDGGFVGEFDWGPVDTIYKVRDQGQLATVFGKPSANVSKQNQIMSFWSAANFLAYSQTLNVVRAANSSVRNATTGVDNILIKNPEDYEINYSDMSRVLAQGAANTCGMFAARYPGDMGNGLKIAMFCDSYATSNVTAWNAWAYNKLFPTKPGTSDYALNITKQVPVHDEMHIVIIDETGKFSGVANTVLEKYAYVSKAKDAKNPDGTSNYYVDVLQRNSNWIYAINLASNNTTSSAETTTWGKTVTEIATTDALGNPTWTQDSTHTFDQSYTSYLMKTKNGVSGGAATDGDIMNAYKKFSHQDEVDISLLIAGHHSAAVSKYVLENIVDGGSFQDDPSYGIIQSGGRKDCVLFVSPPSTAVVNNAGNEVTSIQTWITNTFTTSSNYAFVDSGWKRQYDTYNDVYRWLPLNPDIAGLCARTDFTNDPWWSPAGLNRGKILNVTKLAWNPTKLERDDLYQMAVNPVITIKGEGTVLFGDKTFVQKPSAFDRLNVRRLFIVLEKTISRASKYSLFEFNDEFTRAQFVSLVEPFLRDVKGRRGIYDYKVICDETNNTPDIIDANRFIGDIYVKPARSINYIQLNFVAVRTGVAFSEIAGKF